MAAVRNKTKCKIASKIFHRRNVTKKQWRIYLERELANYTEVHTTVGLGHERIMVCLPLNFSVRPQSTRPLLERSKLWLYFSDIVIITLQELLSQSQSTHAIPLMTFNSRQ
jgi:hypothetical protein